MLMPPRSKATPPITTPDAPGATTDVVMEPDRSPQADEAGNLARWIVLADHHRKVRGGLFLAHEDVLSMLGTVGRRCPNCGYLGHTLS